MTAPPLRIGVIGYGYWGPNLVRNFAADPRTRVVAIAELNPARRQVAATVVPHIKCVAEADAVAIATPIFTHHALAKAALEAGKHVVIEKPLAPSVAEAEELAQLARRENRVLMVDH